MLMYITKLLIILLYSVYSGPRNASAQIELADMGRTIKAARCHVEGTRNKYVETIGEPLSIKQRKEVILSYLCNISDDNKNAGVCISHFWPLRMTFTRYMFFNSYSFVIGYMTYRCNQWLSISFIRVVVLCVRLQVYACK